MKSKEEIAILIVTHNHKDYIQLLLNSLEKFNYKNVFICDAFSNDGTLNILKNSVYKDNLLEKNKLEGFSKNNNDLIRYFNLNFEYFLLLNPDVYFDTDFIKILHEVIVKDPKIGIAAPILKYPNGNIQTTWKSFPSPIQVLKKRLGFLSAVNEIQLVDSNLDWCLGACMLIRKSFVKNNKSLLDERYRLYCEDVDICFEAKQKKMKVKGVKEAIAFHHLNELSAKFVFSKYNYWNIKSIIKFAMKWNFKYIFR
jgi:N-acetylglucosaminyl-diphospho-decaprenol L-rhamnosyltransferase